MTDRSIEVDVDVSINPSRIRKSIRSAVLKTAIEDASVREVRDALAEVGYLPYMGVEPEPPEHPPAGTHLQYRVVAMVIGIEADGEGGETEVEVSAIETPVSGSLAAQRVIEAVAQAALPDPGRPVLIYPGSVVTHDEGNDEFSVKSIGRALGDAPLGESLAVALVNTWGTDVPNTGAMNFKIDEPRRRRWWPR